MMLKKLFPILAICSALLLGSCIQEEPLNAECDIVGVDTVWLNQHKEVLIGTPIITNTSVTFIIAKGTGQTTFAPKFDLTPGAHLYAMENGVWVEANGASRDFSQPQIYKTVSEDGDWSKEYTVSFVLVSVISSCSFEHFELEKSGRYYQWYEMDSNDPVNPRRDYWSSGNPAFGLTGMGHTPEHYPSCAYPLGYRGNAVQLITRDTGFFGSAVGMPIAAGNLFIGEFDAQIAMGTPRKATRFGLQLVGGKPVAFSGVYKYTAGEVFTDKDKKKDPTRRDTCDIYAVVYEVDPDNFVPLDGDNILNSPRIIALARIDNPGEPQEWTRFNEPFRPMNGKEFDYDRFLNYGYAIAIVATSSRQGAYFEGAVGSTLLVDELKVEWDDNVE